MAENEFSLHVDNDWKKQAQEEKRKLAEEQAKKAAETAAKPAAAAQGMAPNDPRGVAPTARGRQAREVPAASFNTLVNSVTSQVLYYLGDLQGEGAMNLDMAKYQLDTLSVLEQKTQGNLNPDEQKLLDGALYETRTRFIGVASQYVNF